MNKLIINREEKEIMRSFIKKEFCRRYNIDIYNSLDIITIENISNLIDLYDTYVLDKYLTQVIPQGIRVSTSNRMTSSGGKTIFSKVGRESKYEIRISNRIMERFIEDDESKIVCGIEAEDTLEALMLILEHEICHVIEFSKYGNSNCKGRRFKTMAFNLFHHKNSYHEILKSENNLNKTNNRSFSKGQVVQFTYKDILHEGIISNINKRATVMVKDVNGAYEDRNRIKYSKWYISLSLLISKE
jgi:predicted SprT family Zn-dependent metalloprotease